MAALLYSGCTALAIAITLCARMEMKPLLAILEFVDVC
jgi:hypothetical protein